VSPIVLLVIAILIVGLALAVWVIARKKKVAALAAARNDAEQLLWRRYNIVGDLIGYAANQGAAETQALFDAVVAARDGVMKLRPDPTARIGAEDNLQRALNAYYAAAYADDELMAEHEVVMILAHLTRADEKAFAACAAYDEALAAGNVRRTDALPLALTVVPAAPRQAA